MPNQNCLQRAVVLWTGGKDSALALHKARQAGFEICALATFAPKQAKFRAHPIAMIQAQAVSANLPHHLLSLSNDTTMIAAYERALAELRDLYGDITIVTGDIDYIAGHEDNWISSRCEAIGLQAWHPLWQIDREHLLQALIDERFVVYVSFVDERRLSPDFVGLQINAELIAQLKDQRQKELQNQAKSPLDLSGEQGEYHSMVADAPYFAYPIDLVHQRFAAQD